MDSERLGDDVEHIFQSESDFVLKQTKDSTSISNVIKNATELVNSPNHMNLEMNCGRPLPTDSYGQLLSVEEKDGTSCGKNQNEKLSIHDLNNEDLHSSTEHVFEHVSASFSILDLDSTDASSINCAQNSAESSRLAESSQSSFGAPFAGEIDATASSAIITDHEDAHNTAASGSEIHQVATHKGATPTLDGGGLVKNCNQAALESTEDVPGNMNVAYTGNKAKSVLNSSTAVDGKIDEGREKGREFKYKSDLTPAMLKYYEHHKDKRPEEYEEVHEALRAWSSDEECKTDRTPRTGMRFLFM